MKKAAYLSSIWGQSVVILILGMLVVWPVVGESRADSTLYLPIIFNEPPPPTDIVINEVLALNGAVNYDPRTTRFNDWIELYNPTDRPLDVSGYFLSDDVTKPDKWQIAEETTIAAGDYLLLWATGAAWDDLYTNFKLSDNGETLVLSRPDGAIVDLFEFGEQKPDVSFGRASDGHYQTAYFGNPTPGTANSGGQPHTDKHSKPDFALASGFYTSTQTVALSSAAGTRIHYTVDGTTPTERSALYTAPLTIAETTVVKARVYGNGQLPSRIVASTYLIDEATTLPVISIGVAPDYLWDDQIGIYVEGSNGRVEANCTSNLPYNWNQDWERPITIEMFENDGTAAFEENAGIKISGNCTRALAQKSLAIHFRDKYDDDTLNYPIFAEGVAQHQSLILRSSASDWGWAMMRDSVAQTIIATEFDWDGQRSRPAVVFINGTYWGIHNIRDKLNEAYIEEKHGYDQDEVDILKWDKLIVEGSDQHYRALITYIDEHDLSDAEAYAYVQTQMDVSQFIDYQIGEIYLDNNDWPGGNIKYWRPQQPDGRWRWLTFDMDLTMMRWQPELGATRNSLQAALAVDGPKWPNPPWSTFLFRNLMTNNLFRDEFLQRFSLYLQSAFEPEHVNRIIDAHKQLIAPEMDRHIGRWYTDIWTNSVTRWERHVDLMHQFADERPSIMRSHLEAYYAIAPTQIALNLTVEQSGAGMIEVSTVRITTDTATIDLYPDKAVTLRPIAAEGYQFVRWQGAVNSTSPTVEMAFAADAAVTAVFEPMPQPVINEIHYNPSGDLQGDDSLYEFIELYNPHPIALDIGGYQLTDGIAYTFTAGTIMPPDSYIVLAQTAATYTDLPVPVYQWTSGGLKNSGETITLSTATGQIADTVAYADDGAWDATADGDGFSLSLLSATSDNMLAENWAASAAVGGSPGVANGD